jgi:nitroimidazol reductase NimA-like FMN-containing flavoprotein (pyridoxamine 5'-phosphate oxidase superfamily)
VIYMHTARFGRTRSNIEGDERVCFSITSMGRMLPAEQALNFSVEYAGVVVFGRGQVIEEFSIAGAALQKLMDKYAPHLKVGADYSPPVEEEIKRAAVYRIRIDSWSGKRKEVQDDFPGAYYYDQIASD